MKKSRSYYTQGIRRKFSAIIFQNGLINNKRQISLIKKIVSDVNLPLRSKYIAHYAALSFLGEDYSTKLNFEDGIAISEIEGNSNPLTPAIYALHCYNLDQINSFKIHAGHLLNQMKKIEDQYYWEYDDDLVRFIIPAPWTSGISQGVIASVMIRLYHHTKDEKYLEISKGAIAYCLDKKNGLRSELPTGFWIEEYPSEKGQGVLNGFLFFLIALAELSSMGHFVEEFEQAFKGFVSRVPYYHKGNYLKYASNIPDLCNPMYDKIHYHQLSALYALTKQNVFLKLKEYWTSISFTNFKT